MAHTGNVPKKMLNGDTDFEFTDFIMHKENLMDVSLYMAMAFPPNPLFLLSTKLLI